jgi:DUF4097 and DUF4098 domain-containing protein YvlB
VIAAGQTRVEYAGGRLLIRAPKGWRQYKPWAGGESIEVQVNLPVGSTLRGDAGVASLRSTGRLGECRYQTGVGDVNIEQAGPVQIRTSAGDIAVDQGVGLTEITTGSGAVSVGTVEGPAVIKNSNGDTLIGKVTGDLRVRAGNGRIVVDESLATVAARSANGDVRLGRVAQGPVVAETAFGQVDIGVVNGIAAWLDLNTKFGTVRNELDAVEGPDRGQDSIEVRAHTSFGDITVGRSR